MKPARVQRLQRFLGGLAEQRLATPPQDMLVLQAREQHHVRDKELVAFLALMLEDQKPPGAASAVLRTLVERLGRQPGRALVKASPEMISELSADLRLGFLEPEAFRCLLTALRSLIRRQRSLELAFLDSMGPGGRRDPLTALDRFMLSMIRGLPREQRSSGGVAHLLPRPAKGSSVCRLHRFLRVMVRADNGIDLGLWAQPTPARIFMPLDGSILARVRWLKLTERERANRGSTVELTQTMRLLNPADPTYYSHGFEQMTALDWDVDTMRQHFRHA